MNEEKRKVLIRDDDLFFTCSLIEYIARETKNTRADVVSALGTIRLRDLYDFADVYHCDNIDKVRDEFMEWANIVVGSFDNVAECRYSVPSSFDIGRAYMRLIKAAAEHDGLDAIDALKEVYSSAISSKIDDYNSSMYYEHPNYLLEQYLQLR